MHLQDCISDNLSGAIAKQEMTSCPRERHTRGLHCHIVFACSIKHYNITQHCKQNVFSSFVGSFGSFWLLLAAFSWFWLVTTNVLHKRSLCKLKLRRWKSKCAYTFLFYKNLVFPAQAEYSYFSADFWLKHSCIIFK